jgi:hypothetical protein
VGPTLRHTERAPSTNGIAHADEARIMAHIERLHGPVAGVWHQIVSDRIHVDVEIAGPTAQSPYTLLVTSGMSARAQTVPRGRRQFRFAELCMLLPADWRAPVAGQTPEPQDYWPLELLQELARIPHDYGTWFGPGHSVPHGEPATPYLPGLELTGVVMFPAKPADDKLSRIPGRPRIEVLQIFPLSTFEMELKLDEGIEYLADALLANGIDPSGPVDAHRHTLRRGDL